LVFDYNDGLIVVTGCLHPGVDALIDISSYFKKRIKGVIGGLHLYNAPEEIIRDFTWKLVEKVNPDFIIPLHCSGRRIIDVLRKTSIKVLELKNRGFNNTIVFYSLFCILYLMFHCIRILCRLN